MMFRIPEQIGITESIPSLLYLRPECLFFQQRGHGSAMFLLCLMPLFLQDSGQSDNSVELVELGLVAFPFNLMSFFPPHRAVVPLLEARNCVRGWSEAGCARLPSKENEHSRAADGTGLSVAWHWAVSVIVR